MLSRIKYEIPDFINEYLVYCDIFVDFSKQKTCLVLTKNLKFLEYKQKQLVTSIGLENTCLQKILHKLINYSGPKCKRLKDNASNESATNEQRNFILLTDKISFGKYAYHQINVQKIYLLIQCWDKLVILQRSNDYLKSLQLIAEYEEVLSYRLVHGLIKYYAILEIKFKNGLLLKRDFQESSRENIDINIEQHLSSSEFKQLMDNVRSAKTELQLHQSITGRSFRHLHNKLSFGVPYIRSLKLEEKQLLARCGDIWRRFTLHDHLVIGVPLVNQVLSPNLTILRNLQPLIYFEPSESHILQCEYRLYQLKRTFEELDSIEAFLETEDNQLQANVWLPDQHLQLLPESFAVLLIKFQISDIVNLKQCPLILTYEIIRDFPLTPSKDNTENVYHLQLLLETLDFQCLLYEQRHMYEISFKSNTLNQDFLAIAMTSIETLLTFTFCNQDDLNTFSRLIKEKYDFDSYSTASEEQETSIEEDGEEEQQPKTTLSTDCIFYNRKSQSLWFGCLLLCQCSLQRKDDDKRLETTWKLYHPHWEKAVMFLKLLFIDLINSNCNILNVESSLRKTQENSMIEFENALRLELNAFRNFLSGKAEKFSKTWLELSKNFFKLQLQTDLILNNNVNVGDEQ